MQYTEKHMKTDVDRYILLIAVARQINPTMQVVCAGPYTNAHFLSFREALLVVVPFLFFVCIIFEFQSFVGVIMLIKIPRLQIKFLNYLLFLFLSHLYT